MSTFSVNCNIGLKYLIILSLIQLHWYPAVEPIWFIYICIIYSSPDHKAWVSWYTDLCPNAGKLFPLLCQHCICAINAICLRLSGTPVPQIPIILLFQRKVNRRDLDNTEYVDMREVQKQGRSHRDMNHNSPLAIAWVHYSGLYLALTALGLTAGSILLWIP